MSCALAAWGLFRTRKRINACSHRAKCSGTHAVWLVMNLFDYLNGPITRACKAPLVSRVNMRCGWWMRIEIAVPGSSTRMVTAAAAACTLHSIMTCIRKPAPPKIKWLLAGIITSLFLRDTYTQENMCMHIDLWDKKRLIKYTAFILIFYRGRLIRFWNLFI